MLKAAYHSDTLKKYTTLCKLRNDLHCYIYTASWITNGNYRYYFSAEMKRQNEAQSYCHDLSAELASITSLDENNFLANEIERRLFVTFLKIQDRCVVDFILCVAVRCLIWLPYKSIYYYILSTIVHNCIMSCNYHFTYSHLKEIISCWKDSYDTRSCLALVATIVIIGLDSGLKTATDVDAIVKQYLVTSVENDGSGWMVRPWIRIYTTDGLRMNQVEICVLE